MPAECTALLLPAAVWPLRSLPDFFDSSAHSLLSSPSPRRSFSSWVCPMPSARGNQFRGNFVAIGPAINQLLEHDCFKPTDTWQRSLLFSRAPLEVGAPGIHPSSRRAFWGSVTAKGTHTWDRINNLQLAVFVSSAGLGLCLVGEQRCC